jgi:hypothetical protein
MNADDKAGKTKERIEAMSEPLSENHQPGASRAFLFRVAAESSIPP